MNWFLSLDNSDKILLLTLLVIAWNSLETHLLRKWQKKQVQASLFQIEIDRFRNHPTLGGLSFRIPDILKRIYKQSRFNIDVLYADRTAITLWEKFLQRYFPKYWDKRSRRI
jgi:hypothetical protein